MANVGVVAAPDKSGWQWTCACGQTSDPIAGREDARTKYKEHRASCTGAGAPGPSQAAASNESAAEEAPAANESAAETPAEAVETETTMASTTAAKKAAPKRAAAKKAVSKRTATKKAPAERGERERKVSADEVKKVMALVESGKSNIMAEARRLGVYHATLRSTCRAVIGVAAFDRIMKGPAKKARLAARSANKLKAAKKAAPARKRAAKKATTSAPAGGDNA